MCELLCLDDASLRGEKKVRYFYLIFSMTRNVIPTPVKIVTLDCTTFLGKPVDGARHISSICYHPKQRLGNPSANITIT